MTTLLDEGIKRAGLVPDLPFVQLLGIRQDRTSYLVYSADGRARVAHVKIANSEAGRDHLATEYATLGRFARLPGLAGRVPTPRAWLESEGTAVSVVSSIRGRPLDVVVARRRPMSARRAGRYVSTVASWLDVLRDRTRQGRRGVDPYAATDLLYEAGVDRDRVERTFRLLAGHAGCRLPQVTAHGDLGPGNVLVDVAGRIGVVGWESAGAVAEPYDDLLSFLLTFVRATLPGDASLADAVTAGLLGGSPWRAALVRRELLRALDGDGVPRQLADPLVLLFLARQTRREVSGAAEWSVALTRYVRELPHAWR